MFSFLSYMASKPTFAFLQLRGEGKANISSYNKTILQDLLDILGLSC